MTKLRPLFQAIQIGLLGSVLIAWTAFVASAQPARYETEIHFGPSSNAGDISIFILRKPDSAELRFRRTDSLKKFSLAKDPRFKKLAKPGLSDEDLLAFQEVVGDHTAYSSYTRKLRAKEPFVATLDSFYTFDEEFLKRHAKGRIVLDGTFVSIIQKADGRVVKKLGYQQPSLSSHPEVARLIFLVMQYYDSTKLHKD